jgi:RNA polymerase sigma-70 factor (ECF subfamily)
MTCYTPCHKELAAYCSALARNTDDAKDLMGDVVEISFRKFNTLKDKSKFKFYLFGIASKLFQNRLRTVYNRKTESLDNIISLHQVQNQSAEMSMDYKIALEAIKKLPAEQQEAILLFEISGFSIHEIAEIQCTNDNTVKTRLSRGREKLRELLIAPEIKTSHGKL